MKSGPEILVVESQKMYELMEPMLKRIVQEPRLVHCSTRREAMQYVASDRYADFIFADWDLSGYGFMDEVRSDPENHHTPVVIMSEDTTNKKIVLNSVTSEATFFLAKPFLEKGLRKKYKKALKAVERRRKNRIHPPSDYSLPLTVNDQRYSLPLVDISIDGCLLRASLGDSGQMSIYQQVSMLLNIDEFRLSAMGEIYRIGHDRPIPENKDTVLIMVKFNGNEQQDRVVQDLIDHLGKHW